MTEPTLEELKQQIDDLFSSLVENSEKALKAFSELSRGIDEFGAALQYAIKKAREEMADD